MDYLWKATSKAKEMLSQKEGSVDGSTEANKSEVESPPAVNREMPATSLSLETQGGEEENDPAICHDSPVVSPITGDPNQTPDGAEGTDRSNIKIGISAGDLKDVSNKAVESAKSIGSFLYGFANKTGKTLTETASKIKTTVGENSMLGDLNKEQEAFAASQTDDKKSECLPWVGTDNEGKVKQQILTLSADKRNFVRSPPAGVIFDFNFGDMQSIATAMLKEDPELEKMRFEVVPKLVNEETFWRNYFYRVSLVKQSSKVSKPSHRKGSADSSSTSTGGKSSSEESIKSLDADKADDRNISQGMAVMSVADESTLYDWEKEMQDYELVKEENYDPDLEKELERMLEDNMNNLM